MKKILNIILICAIMLCVCCAYSESLATTTDLSAPQELTEPIYEPEVHIEINIWFEYKRPLSLGDTVYLHSEIIGGEGRVLEYQWQYKEHNDMTDTWRDIPDATQPTYAFTITRDNYQYFYRLQVTHWAEGEERE